MCVWAECKTAKTLIQISALIWFEKIEIELQLKEALGKYQSSRHLLFCVAKVYINSRKQASSITSAKSCFNYQSLLLPPFSSTLSDKTHVYFSVQKSVRNKI